MLLWCAPRGYDDDMLVRVMGSIDGTCNALCFSDSCRCHCAWVLPPPCFCGAEAVAQQNQVASISAINDAVIEAVNAEKKAVFTAA